MASRIALRVLLTTDGHRVYLESIEARCGGAIDYEMFIKEYGAERNEEASYIPSVSTGCDELPIVGVPDPSMVSTSYLERQNLTMHKGIRRFTRPTNSLSRKLEDHARAVAMRFKNYNFSRPYQTLGCTPAMPAGLMEHQLDARRAGGSARTARGDRRPHHLEGKLNH